jgi:hypothetical protein
MACREFGCPQILYMHNIPHSAWYLHADRSSLTCMMSRAVLPNKHAYMEFAASAFARPEGIL